MGPKIFEPGLYSAYLYCIEIYCRLFALDTFSLANNRAGNVVSANNSFQKTLEFSQILKRQLISIFHRMSETSVKSEVSDSLAAREFRILNPLLIVFFYINLVT